MEPKKITSDRNERMHLEAERNWYEQKVAFFDKIFTFLFEYLVNAQ